MRKNALIIEEHLIREGPNLFANNLSSREEKDRF
jgi:hypothetical protein